MTESDNEKLELIRSSLKLCPNFKGITFIDVFGIFANPKAHRALIDLVINRIKKLDKKIDAVVGLEARGFIFGPQVALELQVPFVPVRKAGKLPGQVSTIHYDLEYGKDTMEMQLNILKPGTKVLLVDDLLATGGTLGAAQKLCVQLDYEVVETLVIIELTDLGGRNKLSSVDHFTALMPFSKADFEAMETNSDQVHQPKNA